MDPEWTAKIIRFLSIVVVVAVIAMGAMIIVLLSAHWADAADRDPQWRTVRAEWLADHPTCQACGSLNKIEVHHVLPVQFWPEKELDPTNLITLCDKCHYVLGHLNNERSYNPCVREDAARHLARVKARPKTKEDRKAFEQQFQNAP